MFGEATVIAVAKSVEAVFLFLATPEGQETVAQWRKDHEKFKRDAADLWQFIANPFNRK